MDLRYENGTSFFQRLPRVPTSVYPLPEALALLMAARAAQAIPGVNSAELAAAIARLESIFPPSLGHLVQEAIDELPRRAMKGHRQTMLTLLDPALAERRQVRMVYGTGSRGGQVTESEALFRTVKSRPDDPYRGFESLQDARYWVLESVRWSNHDHHHSAIRFVTPRQRHGGQEKAILGARHLVYEEAKARHPERWSGNIRNWVPVAEVWLNPPDDANRKQKSTRAA